MNQSTFEAIISARDGSDIFLTTWPKDTGRSAVILGTHGLGEHSGSYWMLAQGLEKTKLELTVSDLRGHGRSAGKRGVATIDEYVADLDVVLQTVRKHAGDTPIFLLGHSMGGMILLKFLIKNPDLQGIKGAILSSPLVGLTIEVPKIKKMSANLLAKMAPAFTLYNEINYAQLSHDPACIKFHETDTWRHDRISARLYLSMMESIDFIFKNAGKIKLPLLMQLAGQDTVVSTPKSKELFSNLKSEKTLKIYDGFFHEIYNEKNRQIPIGDMVSWVEGHL